MIWWFTFVYFGDYAEDFGLILCVYLLVLRFFSGWWREFVVLSDCLFVFAVYDFCV